jgi:hypothetical protein
MNDEQIMEYLRSRARREPPMDFGRRVMAEIDAASGPRPWFASLAPAVATIAAVAVVLVVALLVSQDFSVGPSASPSGRTSPSTSQLPSPAPTEKVSSPSPSPTSSPAPGYVVVEGMPITVLANAEADALFGQVQNCVNEADGFSVAFPASWYTNAEAADLPVCSWFGPTPFEVSSPDQVPAEVWITVRVVEGEVGYTSSTDVSFREDVTIDGRPGRRAEYNADPLNNPDDRAYHYVIPLGKSGPTLVAGTGTDQAEDYGLAKAILDRIMASLTFSS